eukprot:2425357-Pleurochrysis_carterae.AAC.1
MLYEAEGSINSLAQLLALVRFRTAGFLAAPRLACAARLVIVSPVKPHTCARSAQLSGYG